MFDFPTFIALLVAIIAIYIPLYLTLKKEIGDLEVNSKDNTTKIKNRKDKITTLNIICIIIVVVLVVLYQYPLIISIFTDISKSPIFNGIIKFFCGLLPFKKDYFIDPHFKFSFITGVPLSIFIEILLGMLYENIFNPEKFSEYIPAVITLIISAIGLIWANNYISQFLVYYIAHYFELLSIILNIIAYSLMVVIISIIDWFFSNLLY